MIFVIISHYVGYFGLRVGRLLFLYKDLNAYLYLTTALAYSLSLVVRGLDPRFLSMIFVIISHYVGYFGLRVGWLLFCDDL